MRNIEKEVEHYKTESLPDKRFRYFERISY